MEFSDYGTTIVAYTLSPVLLFELTAILNGSISTFKKDRSTFT